MAKYSANNSAGTHQTITSSFKTLVEVHAVTATLARGKISDVSFGTIGTAADQTYEWDISRTTAAGTPNASPVPAPLDSVDVATRQACGVDHTAEPTYTAATSMFYLGTNQRASYRWVAAPGSELVWPATNLAGLGLRTRSVSGGSATATGTLIYEDQ